MKLKLFISLICLLFIIAFSSAKVNYSLPASSQKASAINKTTESSLIYTVRVQIGNDWFIYVYAEDGSLITVLPDEDDHH
jgi:hypothetical protein